MLKTQITGDTMIFRKDFDDRQAYSTTISKKNKDGEYENAYIDVKFKKDVKLENKTKININNAWLTFYINKDKKPVWQIFINDFSTIEGIPEGFQAINDDETDSMFPF